MIFSPLIVYTYGFALCEAIGVHLLALALMMVASGFAFFQYVQMEQAASIIVEESAAHSLTEPGQEVKTAVSRFQLE